MTTTTTRGHKDVHAWSRCLMGLGRREQRGAKPLSAASYTSLHAKTTASTNPVNYSQPRHESDTA